MTAEVNLNDFGNEHLKGLTITFGATLLNIGMAILVQICSYNNLLVGTILITMWIIYNKKHLGGILVNIWMTTVINILGYKSQHLNDYNSKYFGATVNHLND